MSYSIVAKAFFLEPRDAAKFCVENISMLGKMRRAPNLASMISECSSIVLTPSIKGDDLRWTHAATMFQERET